MSLAEFLSGFLLGIACGVIALVYRNVIAYEEPFSAWWRFGSRFENRWFFKPVWACAKCFAGQLALWIYFFRSLEVFRLPGTLGFLPFLDISFRLEGYSLLSHAFAVAMAIFTALILSPLINNDK